eukprot:95471_1
MEVDDTKEDDSKIIHQNNSLSIFKAKFRMYWESDIATKNTLGKLDNYYFELVANQMNDIRLFLGEKDVVSMLQNLIQLNSTEHYKDLIIIVDGVIKLQKEHARFIQILKTFNLDPIIRNTLIKNVIFTIQSFKISFPSKETFRDVFDKTSLIIMSYQGITRNVLDEIWFNMSNYFMKDVTTFNMPHIEHYVNLINFKNEIQTTLIAMQEKQVSFLQSELSGIRARVESYVLNLQKKHENIVVLWQWKDRQNQWQSYDRETSARIELLDVNTRLSYKSLSKTKYKIKKLTRFSARQINKTTKFARDVRRIEKKAQYPDEWDEKYCNNEQSQQPQLKQIYDGDIFQYMKRKLAQENLQLIAIECVQNKDLYVQYVEQKKLLVKRLGNKVNEKWLFHGTKQESMGFIVHDGFRK